MTTVHVPILVKPIVSALLEPLLKLPAEAESYWIVDCTLGGGGHTAAFLEALGSNPALKKHRVLALDQDARAVEAAQHRFAAEIEQGRLEVIHARFGELQNAIGSRPVLGLMADLGFSSDQMEMAGRGLSFQQDGPLDMRLDPSRGQSCREILSQVSEDELERWLREYGEERFSARIASSMMRRRREGNLPSTTRELVDVIVHAIPPGARHGRIHVATRSFQALRIVVNQELEELDSLLKQGILSVSPGGRVAIISFHSLEDRRVKLRFAQRLGKRVNRYGPVREPDQIESVDEVALSPALSGEVVFLSLTKKPIQADDDEVRNNPRSRSAKLRIAERI